MDRLKSSNFIALTLLTGLALVVTPVMAGTDSWSAVGQPNGGTVGKIVVDPTAPSTVYAVAEQQIFKSTDSGGTWSLIIAGSSATMTGDIAIDPQSPSTLYVVFGGWGGVISGEQAVTVPDHGGIYKSIDGGNTWTQIDDGIGMGIYTDGTQATDSLCRIAVDPVHEGVVYTGGCTTGMYKSTNGGAHWSAIDKGIVPANPAGAITVGSIVVDPVTPNVLYVDATSASVVINGSISSYLYRSADGGATWSPLGVNASGVDADLAIDPTDHTHLYFCSSNRGGSVSTDSGATWAAAGCPLYAGAVAFDPGNPAHVIAGVAAFFGDSLYESIDGGATFTADSGVPSNGLGGFGSIVFDTHTPANVYIGTEDWGVLKSTDGGVSWNSSTQGITDVHAGQMLEGSDGIIYMSSGNSGIYKSLDHGATWNQVGSGIAGSLQPNMDVFLAALVQDPSAPSTLYAGGWGGFYTTTDGGATWNQTMTGMGAIPPRIDSIAVDPEQPATIYAGCDGKGICKSVDGAATWTISSRGLSFPGYNEVNTITVDPHSSAVIYAAPWQGGVYKSVDGAATWTRSDSGMGDTGDANYQDIYAIAVDPSDSNTVYAAAIEGFFKSTDAGATWVESDTGMTPGSQVNGLIQIDPTNTSILYVSPKYGYGTTYVSGDAGATWVPLTGGAATTSAYAKRTTRAERVSARVTMGTGGVQQISLGAVMIDPRDHTRVYAGGSDGKVYTYNDLNPPKAGSSGGSSGQGASSSGGGGAFSWLSGLALLFAVIRRKRTQHFSK